MPNLIVGLGAAVAEPVSCTQAQLCSGSEPHVSGISNCSASELPHCYNGYQVASCTSCRKGVLTEVLVSVPGCTTQQYATTCYDDGKCPSGTYKSGSSCPACPDNGNSVRGATSITQCYKTGGSDTSGVYTYTTACYYK